MAIRKRILSIFTTASIVLLSNGAAAQERHLSAPSSLNINYAARFGGRCVRLLLNSEDVTSYCRDYFLQVSLKSGRLLYVIPLDEDKGAFMTLSGGKDQQPRLDRYTLFLDTSRITQGTNLQSEIRVVGTCEMYGDPEREQATHECTVQDIDGGEMHFKFVSDPDKFKVVN